MMFPILFIFILACWASALNCPQLYDYSTDTVSCKATCPSNAALHDNKCLLSNQYLIDNEVHQCERGYVSTDRTLCCKHNTYLISVNGSI